MMPVFAAASVAFVLGVPLTLLARRLAPALGYLDCPGAEAHKDHERAVPYGGGFAVLLAAACGMCAALLSERSLLAQPHSNPLSEAGWPRLGWLAIGAGLMCLLGVYDDFRPLRPPSKLAVQALIATLVVMAGGVRVTLFIPFKPVGIIATVLWLLLTTNTVNLLDNHDGLAAGVTAIAGIFLCSLCYSNGEEAAALLLLALAGGLLAFLVFNFPPASVFLGDAGSLPAGFMLGGVCVVAAFYHGRTGGELPVAVLAPAFVLAVPLFDTLRVFGLRIAAGKPLLAADKRHFSHRLRGLGYSARTVAGMHYLLALLTGGSAMLLRQVDWHGALLLFAQLLGTLILVLVLERGAGDKQGLRP